MPEQSFREVQVAKAYHALAYYIDQSGDDPDIQNVMVDLCYVYAGQTPDPNRVSVPPPPPPPDDAP